MDSAAGWVGLGAAIAAVVAQCRLARRGERWIAAHWPCRAPVGLAAARQR